VSTSGSNNETAATQHQHQQQHQQQQQQQQQQPINSIPSNTPTGYPPNVSKERNRFSGSISPKMDHRKRCRISLFELTA